jgi:uncharacterized Zn finger protein
MFILKSKEQISKAIETARRRHTSVKFIRFGEYKVRGTARDYTVRCERRGGHKVVACECPAGQFGTPCFHSAAALSLHVGLAAQRAH